MFSSIGESNTLITPVFWTLLTSLTQGFCVTQLLWLVHKLVLVVNAMHFSFLHPLIMSLLLWWSKYLLFSVGLQSHFLCYLMLYWGLFEVLYMLNIIMMFESHITEIFKQLAWCDSVTWWGVPETKCTRRYATCANLKNSEQISTLSTIYCDIQMGTRLYWL